MTVTDSMFAEVGKLLGRATRGSVTHENGNYVIGYREGRDVCVLVREPTWDVAILRAKERIELVDRLVRDTGSTNVAVATAAAVPVRFVRIRRRDLGVA